MIKTALYYHTPKRIINKEDLETIIDITKDIKRGVDKITNNYKDIRISITHYNDYIISFRSSNKEYLEKALSEFIKTSGLPYYVTGRCDIVDKILLQYGKALEDKVRNSWLGKHVVDLKYFYLLGKK